jgi:hypothetical protein
VHAPRSAQYVGRIRTFPRLHAYCAYPATSPVSAIVACAAAGAAPLSVSAIVIHLSIYRLNMRCRFAGYLRPRWAAGNSFRELFGGAGRSLPD